MPHEADSPLLFVSTLRVHTWKRVESITIKADQVARDIPPAISPDVGHQEWFDPPLEVSFNVKILVVVQFQKTFGKAVTISLAPQEILLDVTEEDGRQLYRKTEKNIDVVIGIQTLSSTVGKILASCSRFRVLTIGESGVGKSTLINKVFGVSGVDVSNATRGKASIDQEFIAPDNAHFVVHDSCGFEAADSENLAIARDFISRRSSMPDLKDQLHAVWLCLKVPYADGRLMEAGVEQFLKDRQEILGNIPLVVVFTQLDLLVHSLQLDAILGGEDCSEVVLEERKQESLHRLCLMPVRKAAKSDDVPYVIISAREGYEDTLAALVQVTTKNVEKYIKDEAAYSVATIAQRINISLKIALTIAVGEKCYWKALMKSSISRKRGMKAYLDVIHKDIVMVWNLNDPQNVLLKRDFKAHLLDPSDLRVRDTSNIQGTLQTGVTMIAALVTIIVGIAGTGGAAIPIVVPVAGLVLLGKFAHDVYKASRDNVRRLMAYIVDLTCVMQLVFLISVCAQTRSGNGSINRSDIITIKVLESAMKVYDEGPRFEVHDSINTFDPSLKRDRVLDEIRRLIEQHSMGDRELSALVQQLALVGEGTR